MFIFPVEGITRKKGCGCAPYASFMTVVSESSIEIRICRGAGSWPSSRRLWLPRRSPGSLWRRSRIDRTIAWGWDSRRVMLRCAVKRTNRINSFRRMIHSQYKFSLWWTTAKPELRDQRWSNARRRTTCVPRETFPWNRKLRKLVFAYRQRFSSRPRRTLETIFESREMGKIWESSQCEMIRVS